MDIINITCSEIQTPAGFLYVILPLILNHTNNPDYEQSWYSQDGRLLADPVNPQKLMAPVISVSSDRLVTSHCVNLNHEIICDSSRFRLETAFRARNQTAATPNPDDLNEASLQHSDQLWWLFALFVIIIIFLICFFLRKRIFRCFVRAEKRVCQGEDPENRDPESGVQMSFRSDDPRSVNESESEQINGSVFRG